MLLLLERKRTVTHMCRESGLSIRQTNLVGGFSHGGCFHLKFHATSSGLDWRHKLPARVFHGVQIQQLMVILKDEGRRMVVEKEGGAEG